MYKVLQEVNAITWSPDVYEFVKTIVATNNLDKITQEHFWALDKIKHLFFVRNMNDKFLGTREHLGVHTQSGRKYVLVVQVNEKQELMDAMYRDPETTANGRDSFWSQIANRYAGISRADVVKFLPTQEAYQRHQPVFTRKDVIPIATSKPGDLWQVDTIDMNKLETENGHYTRCITIIDHFSKYAWVQAMKDNSAASTATAITKILSKLPKHLRPRKIQSDNGTEFKGKFESTLRDFNIQLSHSFAYTPHAQGCIEVFNKTFKRKVFSLITINDNKNWVDYIEKILDNYNSTRHSRTRWCPRDLFFGTDNVELDNQLRYNLANKMAAHRKKVGGENQENEPKYKAEDPRKINVKDYVRISKHTWNPDYKMVDGERPSVGAFVKKYHANWSREVYVVHQITQPRYAKDFENKFWYYIKTIDGRVLQRQFYRQELMKVDIEKTQNGAGEFLTAKRVADESKAAGGAEEEIELHFNKKNAMKAKRIAKQTSDCPHPWLIGKIIEVYSKGQWVTKGLVMEYTYHEIGTGKKKHKALRYSVRTDVPGGVSTGDPKSGTVSKTDVRNMYWKVSAEWIEDPKGATGSAWRVKTSYDSVDIFKSSSDKI